MPQKNIYRRESNAQKGGYYPRNVLIFEKQHYSLLERKKIDTLINMSCHSGTVGKRSIMKNLLEKHDVAYALGIDGVAQHSKKERWGGVYDYRVINSDNRNIKAKGFVSFPDGSGENGKILDVGDKATCILTLMDWLRGKGKLARVLKDVQ